MLTMLLGLMASGCNPEPQAVVTLDDRVNGHLLQKYEQVEAEKFFATGGRYWNLGEKGEAPVDREVVVPLLKRAREELQMPFTVLFDRKNPKYGVMLLGRVPQSETAKESLRNMIVESEKSFSGIILDEWSEEWLALDFLAPEQVAALGLDELRDKLRLP